MKTKKTGIVDELKEKYKKPLARAKRELKAGKKSSQKCGYSDWIMFSKWAYRVGKGWYGFSLGDVPCVWTHVLDEFFEWLEKARPDFEIHQVKMKFRSMRIYLGTKTDLFIPDEKIKSEISKLQELFTLPDYTQMPGRPARKKHKISK